MPRVFSHRRERPAIASRLLASCTALTLAACSDQYTPLTPVARAAALVATASPKGDRVVSVGVTPSSASMTVGDTTTFLATPRDAKGTALTGRVITWSISDSTIARVSPNGQVTALAPGGATITARSEGRSGSAALTIIPPMPGGSCRLVTDWSARPTTPMAKPGYLASVTEPDFGTRLTRITGDPGTPISLAGGGTAGMWGNLSGHAYAKEPVWNADGSLMVLRVLDSSGGWLFLDGNTYQPLFRRDNVPGSHIALWDPARPDEMVISGSTGAVGRWNVRTQAVTWLNATSGYSDVTFGSGEGNVSADGRHVVILATRTSDGRRVAYVNDLTTGGKGPDLDFATNGFSAVDWVSVSQLGGYIVAKGTIDGVDLRFRVWNRETLVQTVYSLTDRMGHFDLGVDAAGREVAFGPASGGLYQTQYVTIDLATGTKTPHSVPTTWDWHASTRNTARPGWGYGVTNNVTSFALSGEIYTIKLDGSQAVERYGRFRSTTTDYEEYPFASPSPDGKRVAFRSNWGAADGHPIQTYVLDARQICP